MKTSYLFLAEGFEETEATTIVDMMRRAGMPIKTVSITSQKEVKGAHGIAIIADMLYEPQNIVEKSVRSVCAPLSRRMQRRSLSARYG